ncbi:MAG: hypothetical protein RJA47_1688 [Actinomycetota bacterium]|jgi:hypothetical protein
MARRPRLVTASLVGAVLARPSLWPTAIVQLFRLAPRGWWRRVPFLPLPPADYMEFRLVTQYGGRFLASGESIDSADVVDYLMWCKNWNRRG